MTTQAMSDYLENAFLDHLFNATPHSAPSSVHISLHDAAGADETTAAWAVTEISQAATPPTNYVRCEAAPSVWDAASSGQVTNGSDIQFATAGSDWGDVTHIGIWDAATDGNLLFYAALSATRTIVNGDAARFAAGNFVVILR